MVNRVVYRVKCFSLAAAIFLILNIQRSILKDVPELEAFEN